MTIELRPCQRAAVDAVLAEFAKVRATLLVMATGTGKTIVFLALALWAIANGGRVLILAHRDELVRQPARKLAALGRPCAIEKGAKRAALDARIVIASPQSLRGARLARFPAEHFTLVIVDEAHHATSLGYRTILARFPGARVLGVTATPDRLDGAGLGLVFSSVSFRYEMRDAIRDGWLAPIVARSIRVESIDLREVKSRAGDLAREQLAEVMAHHQAVHGVVVPLLELAGVRRTVVFGVDVNHARALAAAINTYRPGAARSLDGETSLEDRERLLADFAAGRFQFLANCEVLTEGFDCPDVACIALARPTKSRALVTQMIGRGTRLAPGKVDCLVLDFVGVVGKHRLAGPADALAGHEVPGNVATEVARLIGERAGNVDEVLATAELAAARMASDLVFRANVRYLDDVVDPFLGDAHATGLEFSGEPATARQRGALESAGLRLPPTLTKSAASRIIGTLRARRAAGLCSYKQARLLFNAGIDPRRVEPRRASELIDKLAGASWSRWALKNEPEFDARRAPAKKRVPHIVRAAS